MTIVRGLRHNLGLTSVAVGALLVGAAPISCVRADGLPNPLAGFMQPDKNDDSGAIDYRPRPTLVVPPSNDLPAPQSSSSVRSANWPKDPDQNAMRAAKADSRQPAPSTERLVQGEAANQKVFVRDDGPNCEPFLGMQIMCFKAPWGGDVQLPGATQSKDVKGVVVTSQPRHYLTDPPAEYLAAVQTQPGSAADNEIPPQKPCATPGWFGCPEQPYVNQNAQAGVVSNPNSQGQQPQQQCMFPGHFGCPALPPKPQVSQAAAGSPAPGQQAAQPAQPKCAMPGWFGCPEQ